MREERQAPQDLSRYVPRVAIEWSGDRSWREIEGSLVFVDISGFTNLSERLARFGRIGAEELTDVLDRVFGTMLDLAYARGGSLLKFGGDALLILFSRAEHAVHACAAAVEMRAALREAAKWSTSVGGLRLRMSVGVHSGPVHLFRAGRSHVELIIAGPTATDTTEMEKAADAGDILVSPHTLQLLPRGSGGSAKGPGHLLRWRKPPVPPAGPVARQAVGHEVASFLPVRLREHLHLVAAEPEHRLATIAFVKFKGTDGLLSSAGPEVVAQALDELVTRVQEAVDDEGVTFLATDLDADGGKVILAAGVPVAQEDDEGRILRVARRVIDGKCRLPVRIGVNRGHVFAGEVGTRYRCAYTVMGDTVNLAARLMAAAPAGDIYATPGVLEGSRTLFATTALEPFHVKGKAEPVQAYSVGAETGARAADVNFDLPLTGRTEELERLHQALRPAHDGDLRTALVIGDVGIGKTRTVTEVIGRLSPPHVVEIRGEPYSASTPYAAVAMPLRRALALEGDAADLTNGLVQRIRRLDASLLPLAPLVAEALHVDMASTPEVQALEPRFRLERLGDAIEKLLAAALGRAVLFFVDDGQWIDETSTHLLQRLTSASASHNWGIIVTRRPEPGGLEIDASVEVVLSPLERVDCEALVHAATDAAPLRPQEVEAVVARAGGNPMFLQEILRAARDLGIENLPDSLDAVVSAQIDRLSPLPRRVLRFAAVLGRSFPRHHLAALLDEMHVTLDSATRRQLAEYLVRQGNQLRFRHALLQEAAYGGLSYRRRQELHLLAGEAIERLAGDQRSRHAATLSFHFACAGDHERAWRYALRAGDDARAAYANVDAAVHYERALDSSRRLADVGERERAEVWIRLGDVFIEAGMFERALDAYRRASRLARGDRLTEAELLLRRARAREQAGSFPQALREIAIARRLLEGVSEASARQLDARLLALAASVRQAQSRLHQALRTALVAAEAAERAEERAALARAYDVLDWALLMLGRPDEATFGPKALALYEEVGDLNGQAMVMNSMGANAYFHGDWARAVDLYIRSRETYLRAGNEFRAAGAGLNIGEILVNQGRLEEAEPLLRHAERVLRASGYLDGAGYAEMQLARLLAARGDLDRAIAALRRASAELDSIGASGVALEAAVHLADCLVMSDDGTAALELLDVAVAGAGETAAVLTSAIARVSAAALAALGRLTEAEDRIEEGLDAARRHGLPYEAGLLLFQRADIARRAGRAPDVVDLTEAQRVMDRLAVTINGEPARTPQRR